MVQQCLHERAAGVAGRDVHHHACRLAGRVGGSAGWGLGFDVFGFTTCLQPKTNRAWEPTRSQQVVI